ncbi:hypothetical protein BU24DRAFT_481654 [Aaosphaeria arxii CBS 175.79]|uniref:Uncharacterized protein n=1 Tax=Aaosphaeria arxii CBS 175.79 TaxID=1450172 RepID=A0A6A5XNB8_9PLEO|nr:uncharacterized protein BU24DRAFT_481654 [Aaosphaeria arxii CBS 175.79]KAF2014240.1 hypothetical protein BU24DRAFT_481654 [Aaosphaeria arxii CBS 175.79]
MILHCPQKSRTKGRLITASTLLSWIPPRSLKASKDARGRGPESRCLDALYTHDQEVAQTRHFPTEMVKPKPSPLISVANDRTPIPRDTPLSCAPSAASSSVGSLTAQGQDMALAYMLKTRTIGGVYRRLELGTSGLPPRRALVRSIPDLAVCWSMVASHEFRNQTSSVGWRWRGLLGHWRVHSSLGVQNEGCCMDRSLTESCDAV